MSDYSESLPEEVELSFVDIGLYNNLRIEVRFADGTFLQVQFPERSEEVEELLGILTRLVNDSLRRRGLSGVEITGLTPLEDDE
jgi:hypothetical protein